MGSIDTVGRCVCVAGCVRCRQPGPTLLREHLARVVLLGALHALLLLHHLLAPLGALLHALLGALLRPPRLLLHFAAAQRTKNSHSTLFI